MRYNEGKADELKTKFWKELADSPFLFLQLDGKPGTAVPMSPQLDKDANRSGSSPIQRALSMRLARSLRHFRARAMICMPASAEFL